MKKIVGVVLVLLVAAAGYFFYNQYQTAEKVKLVTSFDECVAAGFPVRESYPAQCSTSDGRLFKQDIGNALELTDSIQVSDPQPGKKITSPLTVTGQAKGPWFFEATFPVELFDANNKSLGKNVATAQGEWMTESFVPFTSTFAFEKPSTVKGKLIIKNANPSGLTENEKELVIPVVF